MGNTWVNGDFKYDMRKNYLTKKDDRNYIYELGKKQLNTVGETSLLDVYLSKGNSVEFHYHANASELVYGISGKVEVGMINPNDNKWQTFQMGPQEVVSIPQGFFHYLRALSDDIHVLTIYDTDNLQTIFESDVLRVTPKNLLADVYCLDERELKHALAPIKDTIIIGPPADCTRGTHQEMNMHGDRNDDQDHSKWHRKAIPADAMQMHQMQQMERMNHGEPIRYGGTVMREMDLCEHCLREYEANNGNRK